jgi:uncharacterized membrane protein
VDLRSANQLSRDTPAESRGLDTAFRISVVLKGIDGLLEVAGGVILLLITPKTINQIAQSLTQNELARDPHDWIATHILHSANELNHGGRVFAGVYLLAHGVSKVALVIALLLGKLWAYPAFIVLLGAFIVYQLYRLTYRFTIGLTLLTLFDAFVVWLTWREYRRKRAGPHASGMMGA